MTDDLTEAWAAAQANLPTGWTLDSLRCASTGLRPEDQSADWIAVALGPDGISQRTFTAREPVAALQGLAATLERQFAPVSHSR